MVGVVAVSSNVVVVFVAVGADGEVCPCACTQKVQSMSTAMPSTTYYHSCDSFLCSSRQPFDSRAIGETSYYDQVRLAINQRYAMFC